MLIVRGWRGQEQKRLLVMGFFDGLHWGHRGVLGKAYQECSRLQSNVEVLTFYPHPQNFLAGRRSGPLRYLTSYGEKYWLLQRFFPGVSLRFIRFDRKMCCTVPQEFLRLVYSRLAPRKVFVGENFRFGYRAAGTTDMLRHYFESRNIEVVVIPVLEDRGLCISSSNIRALLMEGNLSHANHLLGYPFTIVGKVRKGRKLGSELGFPTANIYPPSVKILPPAGVYVSQVTWEDLSKPVPAVTYIGQKPTVGVLRRRVVETFVPSLNSLNLYGKRMAVQLLFFLREERIFASIRELKQQIDLDLEEFHRYLQGESSVINYPLNAIMEV